MIAGILTAKMVAWGAARPRRAGRRRRVREHDPSGRALVGGIALALGEGFVGS
jgi:hypothetical protein